MKPVRHLNQARYLVHMCVSGDSWRPYGWVNTRDNVIWTGTPIKFDKESNTFETTNTVYVVDSYDGDSEKFWEEVRKDVEFVKTKENLLQR